MFSQSMQSAWNKVSKYLRKSHPKYGDNLITDFKKRSRRYQRDVCTDEDALRHQLAKPDEKCGLSSKTDEYVNSSVDACEKSGFPSGNVNVPNRDPVEPRIKQEIPDSRISSAESKKATFNRKRPSIQRCHKYPQFKKTDSVIWIAYGNFNNYYCGEVDDKGNISGKGKFFSIDDEGYIEGMWENKCLLKLTACEISLSSTNATIRIENDQYILAMNNNAFKAIITVGEVHFSNLAQSPYSISRELINQISLKEILVDDLTDKRNEMFDEFKKTVIKYTCQSSENEDHAETLFQIVKASRDSKLSHSNAAVFKCIATNELIASQILKNISKQLIDVEESLTERNACFNDGCHQVEFQRIDAQETLINLSFDCMEWHLEDLMTMCRFTLPSLKRIFASTSGIGHQYLFLNKTDIQFLCDVDVMAEGRLPGPFLEHFHSELVKNIQTHNVSSINELRPICTKTFYFLMEYLVELIYEISKTSKMSFKDLLVFNGSQWALAKSINWDYTSPECNSLKQQTNLILEMIQFYSPGGKFRQAKFHRGFKMFNKNNRWHKMLLSLQQYFYTKSDFEKVCEQNRVWIYVLDTAAASSLSFYLCESNPNLNALASVFKLYFDFVQQANEDQSVTCKVFTLIVTKFVRMVAPCIGYSENEKEPDKELILEQLKCISNFILETQNYDDESFKSVFSFINEMLTFWKNRRFIHDDFRNTYPYEPHTRLFKTIGDKILKLTQNVALGTTSRSLLLTFFRAFDRFVVELKNIKFTWFIKVEDLTRLGISTNEPCVRLVHNEFAWQQKSTYEVKSPDKFIELCGMATTGQYVPGHYTAKSIDVLLNVLQGATDKKNWTNGVEIEETDKVKMLASLLNTISVSFVCLKEITEFRNFNSFVLKMAQPFSIALNSSSSLDDFIRKMNSIRSIQQRSCSY